MKLPQSLKAALFLLFPLATAGAQTLGTTNAFEGNTAGADSVVLSPSPATASWTASANATWLHFPASGQGSSTNALTGAGSTNVIFTFDANSGATRTGTLIVAGATLAVTQAGATYVAASLVTTLVSSNSTTPLSSPSGVAVNAAGDVCIADTGNDAVKQWSVTAGQMTTLASGLGHPAAVAVDNAGNVFIADSLNSAIEEWTAANSNLTTVVATGLFPEGVKLDNAGNIYFSKSWPPATINKWSVTNRATSTLIVSNAAKALGSPHGVAVDSAGNVYVADFNREDIVKWTAASSNITTLVSTTLNGPSDVAVDGAGNIYIADSNNDAIRKWNAINGTVTWVLGGLQWPNGVAVDQLGNIYVADTSNNAIKEVSHAFVDTTPKTEPASAGGDALPPVLPPTSNLNGPFLPLSDSAWLTITHSINGVVNFFCSANPLAASRTAHITLLGQTISVTQNAAPVTPPVLAGGALLANGAFQFSFTNTQAASFTILTTTNPLLPPADWTVLGPPTNNGSGEYQMTDPAATNPGSRFYRVRSP